jgi:hypothetical protein
MALSLWFRGNISQLFGRRLLFVTRVDKAIDRLTSCGCKEESGVRFLI